MCRISFLTTIIRTVVTIKVTDVTNSLDRHESWRCHIISPFKTIYINLRWTLKLKERSASFECADCLFLLDKQMYRCCLFIWKLSHTRLRYFATVGEMMWSSWHLFWLALSVRQELKDGNPQIRNSAKQSRQYSNINARHPTQSSNP